MPGPNDEVEDLPNDDVQEQVVQDDGAPPELPLSSDRTPPSVDKLIDDVMKESTRAPVGKANARPAADDKEQKLDANGKPIQERQTRGPDQRGPRQDHQTGQVPPRTRDFGQRYARDGQSNIVDKETGKVIAKAGAQYAAFAAVAPYIEKLEKDSAAAASQLKAVSDANALAMKEGLTLQETALGTRLMAAYKKDPVATIKYLLNEAQTGGKDVSSLTGGQAFDPSVIRTMLDERLTEVLKPFQRFVERDEEIARHQEVQRETQVEAHTQYGEFIERFPDASVQDHEIAAIMDSQGMSMTEAYFALKSYCHEHGMKWTSPLGPQISAFKAAEGRRAPNGGGNNRRSLPDMNSRGGNQQQVRTNSRVAAVDDDFKDILRGVFEEHGVSTE